MIAASELGYTLVGVYDTLALCLRTAPADVRISRGFFPASENSWLDSISRHVNNTKTKHKQRKKGLFLSTKCTISAMSLQERRAQEVADALGFIEDANLTGIADEREMQELIQTYFVSPASDSEIESDESEEEADFDDRAEADNNDHEDRPDDHQPDDEPVPVMVNPILPDGTGDLNQVAQRGIDMGHRAANEDIALQQIQRFACTCKYFNSGPCYQRYSDDEMKESRDNMAEMTKCKCNIDFLHYWY